MVSKLAHTIKSVLLSLSFSTFFLFPLDSGFNTHLPVYFPRWSIHTYLLIPRSVCHTSLSRSPAHYALASLLLLPQSDCHFNFWQVIGSSFTTWFHLTNSHHMKGSPEPFIGMSLVILQCGFEVFYCLIHQASNV
jgi:hypothetical protein